jgi:regulator of PEP synthase PpsR (kinase-PPPase family)
MEQMVSHSPGTSISKNVLLTTAGRNTHNQRRRCLARRALPNALPAGHSVERLVEKRPPEGACGPAPGEAWDNSEFYQQMPNTAPSYFHLHLVSDATGETLTIMAKAAAVQYGQIRAIEHVHPLVRTQRQLSRVLQEIESAPGIVLYTIVNRDLTSQLETRCRELGVPSVHVLEPIMKVFESYLGAPQTPIVAGQHVLDADYFRRIDALNFSMAHDDGHLPGDLNEADIIVLGISRTSKTPTSIYLAQRGYKTANVPLVPGIDPPAALTEPHKAFIVGLIASPERIAEIRRNRVRLLADRNLDDYVDRNQIANEIAYSRRLCARHGWPVIDVTRRSIEETAATIIKLLHSREAPEPDNGETNGG